MTYREFENEFTAFGQDELDEVAETVVATCSGPFQRVERDEHRSVLPGLVSRIEDQTIRYPDDSTEGRIIPDHMLDRLGLTAEEVGQ